MSDPSPTSAQDQQTLLGIALADQALITSHIAMFAAKTANPQETLALLHEIANEISEKYQLPQLAKDTMQARIQKSLDLAVAIIGKNNLKPTDSTTH
ncbi:hypothetical protein ACBP82_04355 [Paenalcaligenes hominis]|uniref:hypothetical protein n=1 Tax=Paenalcaligenes hominis TaxID=643674 RepID=UPI003525EA6C